ncbi:MAG TPA: hypothetical protein VHL52_14705, partial [Acidimicrobiia bacterium]|nr:hypothetical protein [Acidimicrobiia bacterium]
AAAAGSTYEEILVAWAGGEAVASAPPTQAAPIETEEAPEPAAAEEPEPVASQPAAAAVPAQPAAPVPEFPLPAARLGELEEEVEPLALGERMGLAGKIGAWTGAILGLIGFVFASTWLLGVASVAGEEGAYGPAVEITTSRFVIGVTLISILFGVVVATSSRAASAWVDSGARIAGRWSVTIGLGAVLGLVLGLAAGAIMTSAFAEPIEAMEGVVLMRVIPAIFVVLVGGAFLGWLTAALVQVVGVPAGIDEEDAAEVADVRDRLAAAFSIPLAAILLLALLVIPLGLVFIRSNEMASGGAAVLAIFAAAAILGISAISASRPTMRIGLGEFMVAAAGIATVVLIIFAVIQTRAGPSEEEEAGEEETATEETTDTTAGETADTGEATGRRYVIRF